MMLMNDALAQTSLTRRTMGMNRNHMIVVALLLSLCTAALVAAQRPAPQPEVAASGTTIAASVVGASSDYAEQDTLSLQSTLGQAVVINATDDTTRLATGFGSSLTEVRGAGATEETETVYLPVIQR
jgi:opacity protein-like surface antigen